METGIAGGVVKKNLLTAHREAVGENDIRDIADALGLEGR